MRCVVRRRSSGRGRRPRAWVVMVRQQLNANRTGRTMRTGRGPRRTECVVGRGLAEGVRRGLGESVESPGAVRLRERVSVRAARHGCRAERRGGESREAEPGRTNGRPPRPGGGPRDRAKRGRGPFSQPLPGKLPFPIRGSFCTDRPCVVSSSAWWQVDSVVVGASAPINRAVGLRRAKLVATSSSPGLLCLSSAVVESAPINRAVGGRRAKRAALSWLAWSPLPGVDCLESVSVSRLNFRLAGGGRDLRCV